MIKGYIISLVNHHESTVATRLLIESINKTKSEIDPIIFPATTPLTIAEDLAKIGHAEAQWRYPVQPEDDGLDMKTGLYLKHYPTKDPLRRVACMVSHMRAWHLATELEQNIVVMEHDAIFTRKFAFSDLTEDFKGGIIGLNDPRGATRKASIFHEKVSSRMGLQPVPSVDEPSEMPMPQGLAGNSAYLISPKAGRKLLDKVREVGMMPNDALMCKQFFPWMQVVYPYYTGIQKGLVSTTTR